MSEERQSTVKSLPKDDGKQAKKKALKFHKKLDDISRAIDNEGVLQTIQKSGNRNARSFPAKYVGTDPEKDTIQLAKAAYAREQGAPEAPVYRVVTEEDAKWLMDKELQRTRYVFDNWFGSLFDLEDINKLRTAQELYPEYFKMREVEIMKQAEMQKRLALMKLYGPRTLEDLQFLYVYLQGRAGIQDLPLHRLNEDQRDNTPLYKSGVFSPSRYFSSVTITRAPTGYSLSVLTPDQNNRRGRDFIDILGGRQLAESFEASRFGIDDNQGARVGNRRKIVGDQ